MGGFIQSNTSMQLVSLIDRLHDGLGQYERKAETTIAAQRDAILKNKPDAELNLYTVYAADKKTKTKELISVWESPKTAREELLNFIVSNILVPNVEKITAATQGEPRRPAAMSSLIDPTAPNAAELQTELQRLYAAAIVEEYNSKEFRDALLVRSMVKVKEDPSLLKQQTAMMIGGYSGAGKTTIAKELLEAELNPNNVEATQEVYSGLIDGGVGREVSQTYGLMLQVSLVLGHAGVSDLHSITEKAEPYKPKNLIKEVVDAVSENKTNKIIPETFTGEIVSSNKRQQIEYNAASKDVRQAFVLIVAKDVETNRITTAYEGRDRAYAKDNLAFGLNDIKYNEKLPCESKEYDDIGYEAGTEYSREALYQFIDAEIKAGNANPSFTIVVNDRVVYVQDNEGEWAPMKSNELDTTQPTFKTTQRMFDAWLIAREVDINEIQQSGRDREPISLEEFAKDPANAEHSKPLINKCNNNDLVAGKYKDFLPARSMSPLASAAAGYLANKTAAAFARSSSTPVLNAKIPNDPPVALGRVNSAPVITTPSTSSGVTQNANVVERAKSSSRFSFSKGNS